MRTGFTKGFCSGKSSGSGRISGDGRNSRISRSPDPTRISGPDPTKTSGPGTTGIPGHNKNGRHPARRNRLVVNPVESPGSGSGSGHIENPRNLSRSHRPARSHAPAAKPPRSQKLNSAESSGRNKNPKSPARSHRLARSHSRRSGLLGWGSGLLGWGSGLLGWGSGLCFDRSSRTKTKGWESRFWESSPVVDVASRKGTTIELLTWHWGELGSQEA